MNATLETAAGNPENQDRGAILHSSAGLVLVVADGVGGRSGGAEAASKVVGLVRQRASELSNSNSCVTLLRATDQLIAEDRVAGETTCALAVVVGKRVYGASVGDSGVWVITESEIIDLTQAQSIRPFIGSGSTWPVSFDHEETGAARLLLATDGLLKYASADRIAVTCRIPDYTEAARRLIELVRYPSGALPDDVTAIVAEL